MRITGASWHDLHLALARANEKFSGNLRFARLDPSGRAFMVRLAVADSKGPGSRYGFQTTKNGNRRKAGRSACWHAHGEFMDALPETAVIRAGELVEHGGRCSWTDRNIGNNYRPLMFSDACDCE